jgi:CHAT domain-containing protein
MKGQEKRKARLQARWRDATRREDVPGEVRALLALGAQALREDDIPAAHLQYNSAQRVIERRGQCLRLLHEALGGRARCMRVAGQFAQALEFCQRAQEAAREHAGQYASARWLVYEAAVRRETGEAQRALTCLQQAEAILQTEDEPRLQFLVSPPKGAERRRLAALAELEGQLGVLANQAGDEQTCADRYQRALDLAEVARDGEAIGTWARNLGNAYARQHRYAEAERCYQAAAEACRKAGDERGFVRTAREHSRSLTSAHRHGDAAEALVAAAEQVSDSEVALALMGDALSSLTHTTDWRRLCEVGARAETLARRVGREDEDLTRLRSHVDTARQMLKARPARIDQGPTTLDIHALERMERYQQRNDALGMADVAHLICDVKLGLCAPDEAGWAEVFSAPAVGLSHRIVGDAMALLCEQEMFEQSLELSQRYKAVAYALPTLRRMECTGAPHLEARAYLRAWQHLQKVVLTLKGPGQIDCFVNVEQVRAAGESLLEAGEALRERDPVLAARLGASVRTTDLLDLLPRTDPAAIVDLFVTPELTVLHILRREDGAVRLECALAKDFRAEHAAQLLRIWFESGLNLGLGPRQLQGLSKIARMLHDNLLCGLAKRLSKQGIGQMVLIPDMLTRHLPLHMAEVCGREIHIPGVETKEAEFLCEVMPVEYAPCLQAVAAAQVHKRPRVISEVTAVADPQLNLPAARSTAGWFATRLAKPIHYQPFVGKRATVKALQHCLEESDVVLFSGHGRFVPSQPEDSALLLADKPWIVSTLGDGLPLAHSPLLVLAACEVGAVMATMDDRAASGMPGALLSAGASSVLASQWPVEDISAGFLVERFLTHLAHRGYRPAAALFRAVRDLRKLPKAEALARCDYHLATLAAEEGSESADRAYILVENLRESIEEGGEYPFASPLFWGGIVVFGSGWYRPAGASVGGVEDVVREATEIAPRQKEAGDLIAQGRYRQAAAVLERVLPNCDGLSRAQALGLLAQAVWYGSGPWTRESATREALGLFEQAERLARAEEDPKLVRWIRRTQRQIRQIEKAMAPPRRARTRGAGKGAR